MSNENPFDTSGQATKSASRAALDQANLGFGGGGNNLPDGAGLYEFERVHPDRSQKNGNEFFKFRLKCVEHETPAHVGKVFEHVIWYRPSGNQTLSMVLADFAKFFVVWFGENAKNAVSSERIKDLIAAAYDEKFAGVCNTQAIFGQPLAGKRARAHVADAYKDGAVRKNAKGYVIKNTRFDIA